MNQEPFKPKPIVKNQLEKSSNAGQLIPPSVPPAIETDPVTRFANELLAVRNELNFLGERIKELYVREEPATVSQVDAILEEAKKGISFSMNPVAVAQQLAPALEENIDKAVTEIEQATREAVNHMSHHYDREARKWHATIGFTSWKSAAAVLVTTIAICSGSIWYAATQHERSNVMQAKLAKSEGENDFNNKYFSWIDEKYPQVWETYTAKVKKENAANKK